ncbi:MAG: hypothetical protein K0R75_1607, partial [Paenibacillaceae bacterium]|nr:hypothetical protein [Paenibacillaceae bacterium]
MDEKTKHSTESLPSAPAKPKRLARIEPLAASKSGKPVVRGLLPGGGLPRSIRLSDGQFAARLIGKFGWLVGSPRGRAKIVHRVAASRTPRMPSSGIFIDLHIRNIRQLLQLSTKVIAVAGSRSNGETAAERKSLAPGQRVTDVSANAALPAAKLPAKPLFREALDNRVAQGAKALPQPAPIARAGAMIQRQQERPGRRFPQVALRWLPRRHDFAVGARTGSSETEAGRPVRRSGLAGREFAISAESSEVRREPVAAKSGRDLVPAEAFGATVFASVERLLRPFSSLQRVERVGRSRIPLGGSGQAQVGQARLDLQQRSGRRQFDRPQFDQVQPGRPQSGRSQPGQSQPGQSQPGQSQPGQS